MPSIKFSAFFWFCSFTAKMTCNLKSDSAAISLSFLHLFSHFFFPGKKKKRFFHSIKPIKVSNRSFPPSLPNPITPFPNCFKWPETSCWIKDTQQLNGCRWKLPAENGNAFRCVPTTSAGALDITNCSLISGDRRQKWTVIENYVWWLQFWNDSF